MWWSDYESPGFWDELIDGRRLPRPGAATVVARLAGLGAGLLERQKAAETVIRTMGITFSVYTEGGNVDRPWPFDVIPRIITAAEWEGYAAGLVQRLTALNLFIADIYGDRKVVADGVFPAELLADSVNLRAECMGVLPPLGVWAHICGSDLVRDRDGTMYVLEDNLRVPSGVSYLLENRQVSKRVFADLFRDLDIHPVDSYPNRLYNLLASLSPRPGDTPVIAVLTPGIFNSAYFEHSFLARAMGVPLVEGRDMFVDDSDRLMLRTIEGPVRVDVLYRRVDDLFLDPEVFRRDSELGTPGLMRAWAAGNVALANAPGAGVADDKVVYAYVPDLIRYYLDEDAKIPNLTTWRCLVPAERSHVLANLDAMVVKPANESGGYGLFIGSAATAADKEDVRRRIEADPRNFVGQPILALSTAPTLCGGVTPETVDSIEPRHLDLRPFILSADTTGDRSYVTPGGLTRVALRRGSLVVNSSQGGGSKDTWIIDGQPAANPSPQSREE